MTTERTALKPCPFCGSVPTPLSDSRVSSNCDPACPCADMSCLTQRWNTRSLTPQAGEGVERVAKALCLSNGDDWNREGPGGLDSYREQARAALSALPPAGRVEELEKALEPFAAAAQLFTSGVHNGGFENVQAFPTAQEWRIAGSLFPEYQGMTSFPKAEALRAALGSHNG